MAHRTAWCLVLAVWLATCATPLQPSSPSPAASGISREQAIEIATQHVGSPSVLVSADFETAQQAGGNGRWIVRFTGNYGVPCPAVATGEVTCPDMHNAVIEIDALTGEFISGTYQ